MENKISDYWSNVSFSAHRESDFSFYKANVKEHISVMDTGDTELSIIDLGCGTGKLLKCYLDEVNVVVGLDFSSNMLVEASEYVGEKIKLVNANVFEYLPDCDIPVWITTEALNQYLNEIEIRNLLAIFKNNFHAKSFYLFETICPLRFPLMNCGLSYRSVSWMSENFLHSFKSFILRCQYAVKLVCGRLSRNICYLGSPMMGYAYLPRFWLSLAKELDLHVEIIGSKYYEYRYHVVLKKR